jgi:hypothetical protein
LTGRSFALHAAALKDKSDKNLKGAAIAFTIGAIVASPTFVDMPRSIDRQLEFRDGSKEKATRKPPTPLESALSGGKPTSYLEHGYDSISY